MLVTGGAGFIGSHLVDVLLSTGCRVTVVDDLSTGRLTNLRSAMSAGPERFRFVQADLRAHLSGAIAEEFDEIYHLAAAVGVRLVVQDPIRAIDTNVELTSAVLQYSVKAGRAGRPARVLVASSSEVYGKSTKEVFSEDDDTVYGPTTVSRWSYALGKAIDEHLAFAYFHRHAVPAVVTRFFNTVGPRQVGEYGMVLPRMVQAALLGQAIEIHGDGRQSRCFCDVRDVAEALPRLLADERAFGRVFNVGSDSPVSIAELADLVIRVTGSASKKHFVSYTDVFGSGFEDLRHRRPDLRRIRGLIGFAPGRSLEQTINDVAAAFSEERA